MPKPDELNSMNELQIDVFREIGNIGASSAATSLSKIVGKRTSVSLPKVRIMDFNEIVKVVGGEEERVVGILQPMLGDLTGNIMFLLRPKEAHDLASILMDSMMSGSSRKYDSEDEFSEMEKSALREIGNMLISSYIGAVSGLTGLRIISMAPEISVDMAGAILSVVTIHFGKIGDQVLYIESELTQDNIRVGGDFFLVPDLGSYGAMLTALGAG